jgi:hypothetical protein
MSNHHYQTWPDSCVAAAMCMIQRWRGEDPTEARFHEENPWRIPEHITTLPRIEKRFVESGRELELRLYLQLDQVVVATALVQNYENWRSTAYPNLCSRHGTMGTSSLYHMVVLISATRDGYLLFDPFYPGDAQPLEVSDAAFAAWFTSLAFIASP